MYPSDLTDQKWERIRHYFEYSNGYGNRAIHSRRLPFPALNDGTVAAAMESGSPVRGLRPWRATRLKTL